MGQIKNTNFSIVTVFKLHITMSILATQCCNKLLHSRTTHVLRTFNQYPLQYIMITKGLKTWQLFKTGPKKNRPVKIRDGKEYTVHHLYWERYFNKNPEILKERELINIIRAAPVKSLPRKAIDAVSIGERRLAYAAVFFMITGFIGYKIVTI